MSFLSEKVKITQLIDEFFNEQIRLKLILLSAFFIFIPILIGIAWINDDAQITFRTIINFINGHGLRWNTYERVQGYTHPLWMLMLTVLYFFTREIHFTVMVFSTMITWYALYQMIDFGKNQLMIVFSLAILISSKSFMDWTSSGLENPLGYLLIALYARTLFEKENDRHFFLKYFGIVSCLLLTRMDFVLIVIPQIAYFALKKIKKTDFTQILMGLSPLILWHSFSLIYYGSFFPNTYYAKLNTGYPLRVLAQQGLYYFENIWKHDFITFLIILLIPFLMISTRRLKPTFLGFGLIGYNLYLIKIGGDSMAGRFFSITMFINWLYLTQIKFTSFNKLIRTPLYLALMITAIYTIAHYFELPSSSYTQKWDFWHINSHGIADERGFYFLDQNKALISHITSRDFPVTKNWNAETRPNDFPKVLSTCGGLGEMGLQAGAVDKVIDKCALTDPYLSRFHAVPNQRIGHFYRNPHEDYFLSVRNNDNLIANPKHAEFYKHIKLITQGDLFDSKRFYSIFLLNTGLLDHLTSFE